MTGIEKAAELHERYGPLVYPINAEDIAGKEGLTITTWPLLPPVEEVKVGHNVGLRDGLSSEWRRWDIAHALGHHLLLHRGNQLVFHVQSDRTKKMRQTSSLPIFLCLRESFKN